LGATAIGTGIGAPKKYIFDVVGELKNLTGLNVARAENLIDATANADVFVEVSGILKALAANLLKISNDLRLLSSGPDGGIGEIFLPQRQAGSSIMPAKVNPVIGEAVGQAAILVMSNDSAITNACSSGNLQINQFMPLIADCMLNNLQLLTRACKMFAQLCVVGIEPNYSKCQAMVEGSTAAATALIEVLGYKKATDIVLQAKKEGKTIRQVVIEHNILSLAEFDNIISAENVTKLGFISKKQDGKNS
jgi:aspartate ammonia-lyase